ncbi:hypothetical protein GSF67_09525 [Agrobacterium sp. CGMCC 11546]|nr:hypothetical protein GSF67_09525 [Agrobacterium sp. CGMCC 11546]
MSDRFTICHNITAKWEGGWSDHKADLGSKTTYGVTETIYHAWLNKAICRLSYAVPGVSGGCVGKVPKFNRQLFDGNTIEGSEHFERQLIARVIDSLRRKPIFLKSIIRPSSQHPEAFPLPSR